MRTTPRLLAAFLVIAGASAAQATVVEGSSSTVVIGGQQTRGGLAGEKPELVSVIPAYEIVTVSARDIQALGMDELQLNFSGWGSYDLAKTRWDAGVAGNSTGDVTSGYVLARFAHRAVTLRAGREVVAAGAGNMLQIDGGDVVIRLPYGISLSGFGGAPVAQRFSSRAGEVSWNPAGGDLAYGGRLGWSLPFAGAFGRGLDLGVSAVDVSDSGHTVRQDAGFDLRLSPVTGLVVTAGGTYSLYESRFAEASLVAVYQATRKLFVSADFRFTSPDLFLSRQSILSVFTDTDRKEVGGGVRYKFSEALSAGADAHLLLEPGVGSATETGSELAARGEWERGATHAGLEVTYLATGSKGYTGGRIYGRQEIDRLFLLADVSAYAFKQEVNLQKSTVTGTVGGGFQLASNWSVVVAGRAGVTPFLEQQADLTVKLVYASSYRSTERSTSTAGTPTRTLTPPPAKAKESK
jgi:hypothetical protein